MPLIEGIGDEVTQFFTCVLLFIIVYIAWLSTYTSEEVGHYRTILLLNHRRRMGAGSRSGGGSVRTGHSRSLLRVRIPTRTLSHVTESITISEGTSHLPNTATIDEPLFSSTTVDQPVDNNIAEDTSGSVDDQQTETDLNTSRTDSQQQEVSSGSLENRSLCEQKDDRETSEEDEHQTNNSPDSDSLEDIEKTEIIDSMDEQDLVRSRRIAHFTSDTTSASSESDWDNHSNNFLPAAAATATWPDGSLQSNEEQTKSDINSIPENESNQSNVIKIKLKYINDSIRVVHGHLEHTVADFKSKHFEQELHSDKIVRLIFNGQVLTDNRKTLKQYGLYNNCVVHCLIHPKRLSNDSAESTNRENNRTRRNNNQFTTNLLNNNNNQEIVEWDLGVLLVVMITGALIAAWYFKFSYPQIYTMTATIGLCIVTGIFSTAIISAYFYNGESQQDGTINPSNNTAAAASIVQHGDI